MADLRLFGATSNLIRFTLKNSSTGLPLTGLTGTSSGLIISTIADVEATATAYTAAGFTIQTITTLGTFAAPSASDCRFAQVNATNHPGLYEFQFADARFAVSNAKRVVISVGGAANLLNADYEIELVQFNPFDGVRLGLTALPNAAAAASGGLIINGSNTGTVTLAALTVSGATTLTGNVSMAAGVTITQSTSNASAFVVTGNGTGHGAIITSGTGATGDGIHAISAATNGNGLSCTGTGTMNGFYGLGGNGTSGDGMHLVGGTGASTGLRTIGGGASVSDGFVATAGTGGVDIRATTIQGDLGGRVLGNTATTISGVGVNANCTQQAGVALTAPPVVTSTVTGTPSTTAVAGSPGLSATNNFYSGSILVGTSGVNLGIARKVSSYVGSTQTFSFTGVAGATDAAWTTAFTAGDTFDLIGRSA